MLRFGDRGNELRTPPGLDDLVRRLPRLVELPVPRRIAVRRVEDRPFEEGFGHCAHCRPARAAADHSPRRVPSLADTHSLLLNVRLRGGVYRLPPLVV